MFKFINIHAGIVTMMHIVKKLPTEREIRGKKMNRG